MNKTRYDDFAAAFREVLEAKAPGLGQPDVARLLGTSQPSISRMLKGEQLPSEKVLGVMEELWGIDLGSQVEAWRSGRTRVTRKPMPEGTPYFNVDFFGGFDDAVNDGTTVPDGYMKVEKYERATCMCNITGHSMEPEISHGDIIVLREVPDFSFLPYGEIYAIVTRNEMRTVKRLGRSDNPDAYLLIPSNTSPEYAPQEILKRDIIRVYEVMGCIKRF